VTRIELEPGYAEPTTATEVEHLLHLVPDVAFLPELRDCVPSRGAPSSDVIDEVCDESSLAKIRDALERVQTRARAENRGGLQFLARTLLHFLTAERIAPSHHPLVVALFLRAEAAAGHLDDTPAAIGRAMDRF
jgi:hypothetical protein